MGGVEVHADSFQNASTDGGLRKLNRVAAIPGSSEESGISLFGASNPFQCVESRRDLPRTFAW
jgi:hypothetical protein